MPSKLTFLFFSIIFAIFHQNGVHSEPPNLDSEFAELCKNINKKLKGQMKEILYAEQMGDEQIKKLQEEQNKGNNGGNIKISRSGIVLKSQFGKYIFAKLQLLEGILANMKDYIPGFENIKEYFFEENSVDQFLREFQAAKGTPFKKFSARNEASYNLIFANQHRDQAAKWILETVLGREREPEVKFIKTLADIGAFDAVPKVIRDSRFPNPTITTAYREMQLSLSEFILQFQQEIVFGQTFIGFTDMETKIKKNKESIADKIKNADEAHTSKQKKAFMNEHNDIEPAEFKKLMRKYELLNNSCAEMYEELTKMIPELISKKAKNEKTMVELKTKLLAEKHKKKFAKVLATEMPVNLNDLLPNEQKMIEILDTIVFKRDSNTPIHAGAAPAEANARFSPLSPYRVDANAKASGKGKTSVFNIHLFSKKKNIMDENVEEDENENSEELMHIIEHFLFLPDQWLDEQGKLFGNTGWLRTKIRLNAGMLLLAYERMKKFYDD